MGQRPLPPGGPPPPPAYGQAFVYGPQPGQGHGLQPPHGAWPARGPRTVFGVPLADGERVLYYRRIPRSPVQTAIAGVLLLPFWLIGVFVLVRAARMRKTESHANVITNRRLFTVDGDGQVLDEMALAAVTGLTFIKRRRARNLLAVRGGIHREVVFDQWIDEIRASLQHVLANRGAIDALPEAAFDVNALPPIEPGRTALVSGLVLAGLGVATILVALVAVVESDAPLVGAVGALGLLAGAVLAAIGGSRKAKAR